MAALVHLRTIYLALYNCTYYYYCYSRVRVVEHCRQYVHDDTDFWFRFRRRDDVREDSGYNGDADTQRAGLQDVHVRRLRRLVRLIACLWTYRQHTVIHRPPV